MFLAGQLCGQEAAGGLELGEQAVHCVELFIQPRANLDKPFIERCALGGNAFERGLQIALAGRDRTGAGEGGAGDGIEARGQPRYAREKFTDRVEVRSDCRIELGGIGSQLAIDLCGHADTGERC